MSTNHFIEKSSLDSEQSIDQLLMDAVAGDISSPENIEAIKSIIEQGASLNQTNEEGNSLLFLILSRTRQLDIQGEYEVFNYCIEQGATLNVKNEWDWDETALAVASGHYQALDILIKAGTDIHDTYQINDGSSVNLLGVAMDALISFQRETDFCLDNYVKTITLLINQRIDVNYQDENGNTALMMSAAMLDLAVPKLLLENGADASLKNKEGKRATDHGQPETRQYINSFVEQQKLKKQIDNNTTEDKPAGLLL